MDKLNGKSRAASGGVVAPEQLTRIPQRAIERLSVYLQCVRALRAEGRRTATSALIARAADVHPALLRRDLSYFGEFGTPGRGYDVTELENRLAHIMGLDARHSVLLVGVGNLGSALLKYSGFSERGFHIVAGFDADDAVVGQHVAGLPIYHMKELSNINRGLRAQMGVVAVPRRAAQEAVDHLVAAGVKAILNFAGGRILVRPGIVIRNVDLTSEMEVISYYLNQPSTAPRRAVQATP